MSEKDGSQLITKDTTRNEIDDEYKRNIGKNSYKNRYFGGKRTAKDEYTGGMVHYAAKGKDSALSAGRHYTPSTTANTDHVVPIDVLTKKYEGKITEKQMKAMTNSDYNLAITNERLNKSKGAMQNHQYLYEQFKKGTAENGITTYNMLYSEITSSTAISTNVTVIRATDEIEKLVPVAGAKIAKTTENLGSTMASATASGTSSALISLTVSGVNNLVLIATGDKSVKDGIIDIATDTAGSFVSAAGADLVQHAVSEIAKQEGIKSLAKEIPVAAIATGVMVTNSVIRFINDDISAEECVTEILMNGAGTLAFQAGMVAGGPAGAVIATILVGQISKIILEYKQQNKVTAEKERQFNRIVCDALFEMEQQRRHLQVMVEAEYEKNEQSFNNGYELIFLSMLQNDAEGISTGIDSILSAFNQNSKFKTQAEFDLFFDDENAVLTL